MEARTGSGVSPVKFVTAPISAVARFSTRTSSSERSLKFRPFFSRATNPEREMSRFWVGAFAAMFAEEVKGVGLAKVPISKRASKRSFFEDMVGDDREERKNQQAWKSTCIVGPFADHKAPFSTSESASRQELLQAESRNPPCGTRVLGSAEQATVLI